MNFPTELKYSRDDEWVKMIDDTTALIGISDYAQDALSDVVFVTLPAVGDAVAAGQEVAVLEAMKMENSITADAAGYVKQILVVAGENVATDAVLIELSDAPVVAPKAEAAAPKAVTGNKVTAPLPGRVIALKVKAGDVVKAGDEVAVLEAMKMENSITSDYDGTVQQVAVAEGDNVATDAVLMVIG